VPKRFRSLAGDAMMANPMANTFLKRCGYVLLSGVVVALSGCSDEIDIADLKLSSIYVEISPQLQGSNPDLKVGLGFARAEGDDACYELSSDTRATVDGIELTAVSLGGSVGDKSFTRSCDDSAFFERRGVSLASSESTSKVRIEDGTGHIELAVTNLLVERKVSFLQPADGHFHAGEEVTLKWSPPIVGPADVSVEFFTPQSGGGSFRTEEVTISPEGDTLKFKASGGVVTASGELSVTVFTELATASCTAESCLAESFATVVIPGVFEGGSSP
jgi:hypothetical protein